MKKRAFVPMKKSKRMFTKTAKNKHPKNMLSQVGPMRGGIRL